MTGQWTPQFLRIQLLSDATFSRGEGTAGFVDTEIEHDGLGIPFIGGKTIRGLLRDSWLSMSDTFPELADAAERVLGCTGSMDEECRLRIGDALFPEPVRQTIEAAKDRVPPETILATFTAIRAQTAEDRETGAPAETTLRTSRVLLRGFALDARLNWLDGQPAGAEDVQLLALAALATRHGGLARNRGRGHIQMTLDDDLEKTQKWAAGAAGEATP
jgi:hypothetical protein